MGRWTALAASLLVVFVGVGAASSVRVTEVTARGSACRWTVVRAKHRLWELTSTPQGHMWALGPGPRIERFDGRRWDVIPSPRVKGGLGNVAALSESYAWAVGFQGDPVVHLPLIERWDGRRWQVVPSPPVIGGALYGVAVTSVSDAWAVGDVHGAGEPLIVHWDGKLWSRVRSTLQGSLYDVTASAPDSALAVGGEIAAAWDGTRWRQVPTPFKSVPDGDFWTVSAVAGFSGNQAWAVGFQQMGNTFAYPIIERWNGHRFRQVAGAGSALTAVAARSADDAWAVGLADPAFGGASVARWNGRSWQDVATPRGSGDWLLDAVAVPRRGDVWTVGTRDPDPNVDADETNLIAHLSCR